jgi:ABC-2 type transport system permease protein
VQFMPAVVFPQILLCGLFLPREELPAGLDWFSDLLPLSYAVDAMTMVAGEADTSNVGVGADLAVIVGFTIGLLALGAATLRRRTA